MQLLFWYQGGKDEDHPALEEAGDASGQKCHLQPDEMTTQPRTRAAIGELRTAQLCAPEPRPAQVGAGQITAGKLGAAQVQPAQIRAAKIALASLVA